MIQGTPGGPPPHNSPILVSGPKDLISVPWATFFNSLFNGYNTISIQIQGDPRTYGARGDGIQDDTKAVQSAVNATNGVLFLAPGKAFLISSSITVSGATVFIYGGGQLTTTSNISLLTITGTSYLWIEDIVFNLGSPSSGTCVTLTSAPGISGVIEGCFFQGNASNAGIGISSTGGVPGLRITGCEFSFIGTGISLTTQTDVNIVGTSFESFTTAVGTSGTCTYNLRGCNVVDFYDPQVPRAVAYQGTAGQALANGSFVALTFDTNAQNIGSIHSTSTNPTRFTAPVKGFYTLWAQYQLSVAGAAGTLQLQVNVNGGLPTPLIETIQTLAAAAAETCAIAGCIQLNANDYVEYVANQSTGAGATTHLNTTFGGLALLSQP